MQRFASIVIVIIIDNGIIVNGIVNCIVNGIVNCPTAIRGPRLAWRRRLQRQGLQEDQQWRASSL